MSDYIQIAKITGHLYLHFDKMNKDDFYTLCMKNPKENLGIRKKNKNDFLITFKTSEVSLDYLCSDFLRFCLSLYKNNQNTDRGEMLIIPKSQIPISEELKNYIDEFIPDFHRIRG